MVHWFYLDLNSFFASCEQQENPALRGQPIAIVPMLTDSTAVLAASYPAKAYGIKTGTRVGDAKKLCPHLKIVVANHKNYVKYHHLVIAAVESCLPVHSVCSIDEIACELTGTHSSVTRARELSLQVKKVIAEKVGISMTASIGLAPNKYLAKVAADMQKPDGLTVITKPELPDRLRVLQLRDLPGIGVRMETRLWAQGIRSMDQLLACNEQKMRCIWGSLGGARLYRLLRGESIEVNHRSGVSVGHEHVLPPSERSLSAAFGISLKLLSKAAQRVRESGKLTRRMHVGVKFLNKESFYQIANFDNTNDTTRLAKTLMTIWKALPPEGRPLKVSITLGDFVTTEEEQLSFFERPQSSALFKCVDEINKKHGQKTIFMASLLEQEKTAPSRIAFARIPELKEFE